MLCIWSCDWTEAKSAHCTPGLKVGEVCRRSGARGGRAGGSESESQPLSRTGNKSEKEEWKSLRWFKQLLRLQYLVNSERKEVNLT